jgi:hypothetical protein
MAKEEKQRRTDQAVAIVIPTIGASGAVSSIATHNLLSATHADTTPATPTLGDMIYADEFSKWVKLAGNITTTRKFLMQVGSGAVADDPAWSTLIASDVPALGGNPSQTIGLTAVNGVATTYLRSDGAPALSQAIVPTWTGQHSFAANPIITNTAPSLTFTDTTASAKSLTIKVDSDIANIRESAAADGSLLQLDLAGNVASFGGAVGVVGMLYANGNLTINNAAPSIFLTDSTASAKSLTIAVDANVADLRESAGASGSLLALDLANNRVGIGVSAPSVALDISGTVVLSNAANRSIEIVSATSNAGWLGVFNAFSFIGVNRDPATGTFADTGKAASAIALNGDTSAAYVAIYATNTNNTNPPEIVRFSGDGNVGIGTSTFGTSAAKVLSVFTGTAPTTGPADSVQFYSSDDSAGNTIPSFFTEGSGVVATGQADSASSVRVKMRINGTVRTFLCI